MGAKDRVGASAGHAGAGSASAHPLLLVDIDGVISLFGAGSPFAAIAGASTGDREITGSFHSIEGIPHFLSSTAAAHLLDLARLYELVWASGWEERAEEHLPHLLGLPRARPFLRFHRGADGIRARNAHWKLDAIDAFAGARALAWIDDAIDEECRAWARERLAPTLLVQTDPARGLTGREANALSVWARSLAGGSTPR